MDPGPVPDLEKVTHKGSGAAVPDLLFTAMRSSPAPGSVIFAKAFQAMAQRLELVGSEQ